MKNLSLFVSAFALCASTSYAAINCSTLPTCASLGYTDTVTQCPKSSTGADMALKCPFDTSMGKCVYEAAVGQIAYFTKTPNTSSGWLLCDGRTITKAMYPELYAFLGTQFCTADHGGTCGTDVGRLPKYAGYFLRVYGTPSSTYGKTGNTSFTAPQKEGLPNITGKSHFSDTWTYGTNAYRLNEGAFSSVSHHGWSDGKGSEVDNATAITFDASRSNAIYGAQSGVTPPNFAVYAYIYAGKVVK